MKHLKARNTQWTANRSRALMIIQACKLWRNYVLRCGSLWSASFLDCSKFYPAMLERAGVAALSIRYPPFLVPFDDADNF
jgi:hypothetical protein